MCFYFRYQSVKEFFVEYGLIFQGFPRLMFLLTRHAIQFGEQAPGSVILISYLTLEIQGYLKDFQ